MPKAQIVAAGFNHTLDKALMLNFVEKFVQSGEFRLLLGVRR